MPLLTAENPRLAENLSAMALRLRQDADFLQEQSRFSELPSVETLRELHPALRSRMLEAFLKESGVREPEQSHIAMAEALVFSGKPSARAVFPGGIVVHRKYDRLEAGRETAELEPVELKACTHLSSLGLTVLCEPAQDLCNTPDAFTVHPRGKIMLRSRQSGDVIRLSGGTKSLKKLFIDRKIPASERMRLPVITDEEGILGVYSIGTNLDRAAAELPAVTIRFVKTDK